MSSLLFLLVTTLSFLTPGRGAYAPDLITNLPGYDGPIPYTQYSGYLNGSEDGNFQLHYWFVTSQSDPESDPLVLWLNGGPGCSSLGGMLYEHGPLLVNGDGTHLTVNEWAWNKLANMIYLESPASVGFSFSRNGNCSTSDDGVAEQNYQALLSFLDKFQEYRNRDLYIAGESYGSIYVSTLSRKILKSDSILQPMLKGYAIGNGGLSWPNNTNSQFQFAYNHGILSSQDYYTLLKTCGCDDMENLCHFKESFSWRNWECRQQWISVYKKMNNLNLNAYNVIAPCFFGSATPGDVQKTNLATKNTLFGMEDLYPILASGIPCVNSVGATNYLNQESVREALHIDPSAPAWSLCAIFTSADYSCEYIDVKDPVTDLVDNGIRGIFYFGDVDSVCNFIGGEYFVKNLGYPSTSDYTPWYLPNQQIGGWWMSYGDNLQFSTVRGAGHMVAQDKPMHAYVMWEAFLTNKY